MLITLGIIGIVAAMTIPNLMSKWVERARVVKLKETYSQLNQAFKLAYEEDGDPTGWVLGADMSDAATHSNFTAHLKHYLKVGLDCDGDSDKVKKACLRGVAQKPGSIGNIADFRLFSVFTLQNGVTVGVRIWSPTCSGGYRVDDSLANKNNVCGLISVYLEPDRTVQKGGENEFDFFITTNGIVPFGLPNSAFTFEQACNKNIATPYPGYWSGNMYACAAWVLQNENLDYLKCPGELSWTGAKRCPR